MPIGLSKAPDVLPETAKKLWVDTFNGVLEDCDASASECDEQAAKIAWNNVKGSYRKVKDEWVARKSEAYHDILLTVTKASLQPDGSVRWQAVASDTGKDKANEQTSGELFQDWIDRVTYKSSVPYLPEPKMPFLGVSHYPALDGYGEAGVTHRMYIDGSTFKADGIFNVDNSIGQKLLDAVRMELALVKKGDTIERPIRISAGWWDLQHYHEDSNYLFTRQSLTDKCPICQKGQMGDKIYKAGQLDHFASTRVPMHPRTNLELEEKSMTDKITRREDAESIIGADGAEEMERRAQIVGKSEAEGELPPGMVIKAATKIGGFIKRKREDLEMSLVDLADQTRVTDGTIGDIESGVIETPSKPVIADIAKALDVSEESLLNLLPGNAEPNENVSKNKGDVEAESSDDVGIDSEKMGYYEVEASEVSMRPFGGATSIKDAEGYIETKEKMNKLYSHWDVFQAVVNNIMTADDETIPDRVAAMAQAVGDLGNRIDTLKAGLSDAFLIQESSAAYEAADDNIAESPPENEVEIMSLPENQTDHPADQLKAAVDATLTNQSLPRSDQEKAVQAAFNVYAQSVQAQLDQAHPMPPADQMAQAIKGALAEVLTPLAEQVGLLTAKMSGQPATTADAPQQVFVPQQKSMVSPAQTPQPVQAGGNQGNHVSPVTGQPSPLTDSIRKSVGLHN